MTKEEILKRLDELDQEAVELKAESDAITHLLSLVNSDCSSRMDEILHEVKRREDALSIRITKWRRETESLAIESLKLVA